MAMLEEPLRKTLEDPSKFLSKEYCFGFYDWFCSTEALERKGRSLLAKVRKIAKSTKINLDTSYLWFKNNCPMVGGLYDDFRIADIKTGDVLYTVVPKTGHTKNKNGHPNETPAEIWGFKGEPKQVELYLSSYKDVVAWFMAENSLIASMPDTDIPLHLGKSTISIEGQRILEERLKKG